MNIQTLSSFLNEDQLQALNISGNNGRKIQKWNSKTIQKALELKFACGTRGYEELLKQKYPLPSCRTLTWALEQLHFSSGISEEMFEFLKVKAEQFKQETDKECSLILDEMAITEATTYDVATQSYFGDVTLPGTSGKATHALVFMFAGSACRWKQIVGYCLTGDGYDGVVEDMWYYWWEVSTNSKPHTTFL